MSLLKARKLGIKPEGYGELQKVFLEVIDSTEEYGTDNLVELIQVYTIYSVEFLIDIGCSLEKPKGVEDTMKLMNSFIAEITVATNNKYYHKEEGYTIIDKCIQYALDNGGTVGTEFIYEVIDEINNSYIEEEIEAE